MGRKYKFHDHSKLYFVTLAVLAVRHLQCRTTDKKDLKSNLSRFEITNLEQRERVIR